MLSVNYKHPPREIVEGIKNRHRSKMYHSFYILHNLHIQGLHKLHTGTLSYLCAIGSLHWTSVHSKYLLYEISCIKEFKYSRFEPGQIFWPKSLCPPKRKKKSLLNGLFRRICVHRKKNRRVIHYGHFWSLPIVCVKRIISSV